MYTEETTTMSEYKKQLNGHNPAAAKVAELEAAAARGGFDAFSDEGSAFSIMLMSAVQNAFETDFSADTLAVTVEEAEKEFIRVVVASAEELLGEYLGGHSETFRAFL